MAIQAKILLDTLKEFPEQPLTFNIDLDAMSIDILSANGKFSITGQNGEDFPVLPTLSENKHSVIVSHDVLLSGINKTSVCYGR